MLNLILSGDNVLIRFKCEKSFIIIPEKKQMSNLTIKENPEIVYFSKRAKETFPEIEAGKKILIRPDFDFKNTPFADLILGLKNPNEDRDAKYVHYFIKVFDILAIINE